MTAKINRPATQDALFLWVMHRFSEVFEDKAIMKGGMVLRLLDCPRFTNDIDYVFAPFDSKKEIVERITRVLGELEDAELEIKLHSKMLRADLRLDGAMIQVEANVAMACDAVPMATASLARSLGQPSQVIRIMSLPQALAHKLAAWNERRLSRDLYDAYFLQAQAGAAPDLKVLDARLAKIESRLPKLRTKSRMSRSDFASELRSAVRELTDDDLAKELSGLMSPTELTGLAVRIRVAVERMAITIESAGEQSA
ncbi:MAG: putative nucleotidyltransferase component of viral defense system [Planctomycetota bacterium]|jgi:predicted nucleotidyltransferase component of viral defense system